MLEDPQGNPPVEEVKNYLDCRFGDERSLLHSIRTQCKDEQLPEIQISVHVGKMMYLMAKMQKAKRILEIGTLGGYSTAWLAQALPHEGRLISLEINEEYAEKAKKHLKEVRGPNIEIRVGHAVELLAKIAESGEGPFDLIFIDADKENYALYLDWSLRLSREGTVILIDNLIPKGPIVGYPCHDEAKHVYAFNDYLAQHPMLEVAVFPTLTRKQGRLDAMAVAYVKGPFKVLLNRP